MVSFTVFKGSKSGDIVKSNTTRELGSDEVLIKVSHSGVCGTDEHYRHSTNALGHEGAGTIEKIGSAVTTFKEGDHVGWGYVHSSCGECVQCLTGRENLCPQAQLYGSANTDQGSFATHGVWKESYVFKLPETLELANAAPLMCGGATVFHVLASNNIKPTDRVGVIGIGGLGHLAIQFAAKMGCEVVVFSSTESKKEEATKLGASQFVTTKGKDSLDIGRPINHLLVTTSSPPDWKVYLPLMAPSGSIYPVTVDQGDLKIPYMQLIGKELSVKGSMVAPRQVHRDMITFAAHHGITPIIEQFPLTAEGITEAMDKLRSGKMRYRGVLVAQ